MKIENVTKPQDFGKCPYFIPGCDSNVSAFLPRRSIAFKKPKGIQFIKNNELSTPKISEIYLI